MIDETLSKLQARIRAAEGTSDSNRQELLELVAELRSELAAISETHTDDAARLAEHTHAAAEGAHGVEDAMMEFETAHPKIVGLVRSFLHTLAEAGI